MEAESVLESALSLDFENSEIQAALKCGGFWKDKKNRLASVAEPYDQGEFLLKSWRDFAEFLERIKAGFDRCLYAIRQWVFGHALAQYLRLLEANVGHDPELLFRIGRCFKGKGDYEHALEFLEAASSLKRDDPGILAELADCYALVNEVRTSKAFFREAFFIDAQKVDLAFLESTMIRRLIEHVRGQGYLPPFLEEWIPVYGVVTGVFNIKRELKSLEYGKLRQSIYAAESKIEKGGSGSELLVPRLINNYFWLIDHYINSNDEREKVEEVLLKIRKLDPSMYEQITN